MLPERYRQAVAAFNRRDLDAWLEFMTEDVEIESRFSRFGQNRFRGHRAMQSWWDDLGEAWESMDVHIEEVHETGPDETLSLIRLEAKGRESGVVVSEPAAHRVCWRAGRWVSMDYVERAEAEAELARHRATRSSDESSGSAAT
jgi:ketosteroid isomerase-like protein